MLSVGAERSGSPDNDKQLAEGANAVFGPILAEIQTGTESTPDSTCAGDDVWTSWCGAYTGSLSLLSATISAAPPRAVRILWAQLWKTVLDATEVARALGSAAGPFQELAEAVVGILVELPRCFAAPAFAQEETAALSVCSVASAGFATPTLLNRSCWLRPLSATVRHYSCQNGNATFLKALVESFPTAVGAFLTGMDQAARGTDENVAVWSSMYSLILDLALTCPAVLSGDAAQLPLLLDMLVGDLMHAGGCAASDRTAGIVGLRVIAKLREWASVEQPESDEARRQLAQLVQQWLVLRGEVATAVGILVAASGALPPWMIDNLADALWGLGELIGGERLGAVLHVALCSEVLPYPVRRLKPEARTTVLGPLLSAKDRRVFKRSLKAMCGGKKKGMAGAPPAAACT